MQIENFHQAAGEGSLKATFDVFFPSWEMTFVGVKLILAKRGNLFISFPAGVKKDEFGNKEFFPYIRFSERKKKDFEQAILKLLPDIGLNTDTKQDLGASNGVTSVTPSTAGFVLTSNGDEVPF